MNLPQVYIYLLRFEKKNSIKIIALEKNNNNNRHLQQCTGYEVQGENYVLLQITEKTIGA